METFDFDKQVLSEFAFLGNCGFKVEEALPTIVRYVSPLYRINVFYGPRTREIGLEFGPVHREKHEGYASVDALIAVFDSQAGENFPIFPPVTTRDGVADRVQYLASSFQRYVKLECLSSPVSGRRSNPGS